MFSIAPPLFSSGRSASVMAAVPNTLTTYVDSNEDPTMPALHSR
jgi:hypothetical protein